jgi:enoyl-CoA hydratase/carnithine racemase
MSNDSVLFEVREKVAHVTLNRPQAGNCAGSQHGERADGGGFAL